MNETQVTTTPNAEPTRGGRTVSPSVDIFETEHELVMYADLPGVAPADLDLRFEDGELILRGKVAASRDVNFMAREFESVDYYRSFRVHDSIDSGKIDAEYRNGVLTVHLPKEAKHQPRQVAVKVQ